MHKYLALIAPAVIISGCSYLPWNTEPEVEDNVGFVYEEKLLYEREYTLIHEDVQGYGAGLRTEGYIHVLSQGETDSGLFTDALKSMPDKKPKSSQGSYSFYDSERWKKYCAGGKELTHTDWKILNDIGLENVPATLSDDCRPPSFTYHDVMKSVTEACYKSNEQISPSNLPAGFDIVSDCSELHSKKEINENVEFMLAEEVNKGNLKN